MGTPGINALMDVGLVVPQMILHAWFAILRLQPQESGQFQKRKEFGRGLVAHESGSRFGEGPQLRGRGCVMNTQGLSPVHLQLKDPQEQVLGKAFLCWRFWRSTAQESK